MLLNDDVGHGRSISIFNIGFLYSCFISDVDILSWRLSSQSSPVQRSPPDLFGIAWMSSTAVKSGPWEAGQDGMAKDYLEESIPHDL